MRLIDIPFTKKIYLLLAVPLLGLIWLGCVSVERAWQTYNEMSELTSLTQLASTNSTLVHELQKERGMTAGFLGSKGTNFVNKLANQRRLTEQALAQRAQFLSEFANDNAEVRQLNRTITDALQQINSMRSQVDNLSTTLAEALGYYTAINAKLLSISELIADISTNAKISEATFAYYSFIQGKERAGIERAVLSNTFAKDAFGPGIYAKFITLVSEQNTYFANFNAFANQDNVAFYRDKMSVPAVDIVESMRAIANEKSTVGGFAQDPVYWFEQSTKRIIQLKTIENQLADSLLEQSDEIKSKSLMTLWFNIIITVVLIVIAKGIALVIIRELKVQVHDLTKVMRTLRDDDDLTVRAKYIGESELGQVSAALNLTLDKFSAAIDEISTSSHTLAKAADNTSGTCAHNLEAIIEQQDEIGLIATAIEELSVTVKEVAGNTQMAADSAKDADEQTHEGLNVVKRSYQSIEKLAQEIKDLSVQITKLHESSNNITSVVDVIKSVAEQTNLLALNAAIEAARAGEQGRGFAVVADEVRTLAQRTQDSTSEIESFIGSLQSDVNGAFSVIDNSQRMADEAVDSARNVEQTLTSISESVGHIFSMTEQVATAVEEQAMVTQDVAKNVVNVEHKSTESTNDSKEITQTAKEQAQLALSLQNIAVTFKT